MKTRDALPAPLPQSASSVMLATWLAEVDKTFRQLCHGDARILSDSVSKVMAKETSRLAMLEDPPKRFGMMLRLVKTRKPSEEELTRIEAMAARRRLERDHLVELLGCSPVTDWDGFYRDHSVQGRLAYLGAVLVERRAMRGPAVPVLDEARRIARKA